MEHLKDKLINENCTIVWKHRKTTVVATVNSVFISTEQAKATTERIVKAWNSHDEAISALQYAESLIDLSMDGVKCSEDVWIKTIEKIKTALKNVE